MANLDPELVAKIHHLRRTTPLTLSEISERLSVSRRTVGTYARQVPQAEVFDRRTANALDPAIVAKVEHLIKTTDLAFYKIGNECGTSGVTVARIAGTLEPGSFPQRLSNAEKRVEFETQERIVELAGAGMHPAEIARRVGRHQKTVSSVMVRNGKRIRAMKAEAAAAEAEAAAELHVSFADKLRALGFDDWTAERCEALRKVPGILPVPVSA